MKKTFLILILFLACLSLTACMKFDQPEYDINNFESFTVDVLEIDGLKTIDDYEQLGYVAAYYKANDITRVFFFDNDLTQFISYMYRLFTDETIKTVNKYFNNVINIDKITVSKRENILYFLDSDMDKTYALSLTNLEDVLTVEEKETWFRLVAHYSGLNLDFVFLPVLINDGVYQRKTIGTIVNTISDNLNGENNFYCLDFCTLCQANEIYKLHGTREPIEIISNIEFYVDDSFILHASIDNVSFIKGSID